MADVDTSQDSGKKGSGPKTKKKSTRIDMTAMVDVAFLLLTFFVLTATMTNTNVMELTMPPKVDESMEDEKYKEIDEKKIMTILLYEKDTVKHFVGITNPEVKNTTFAEGGIDKAIRGHLNYDRVLGIPRCRGRQAEGCWDPIFLIKAKPTSRYKNLIDLLDELAIEGATKYAIDKFSPADSIVVAESRIKDIEGREEDE
ncbi:MAG: biopolymer transporter ExbD [Bacteroidia bacterium]|nr:biopolymer transporter ExbD [Bacteroidia bacterium]